MRLFISWSGGRSHRLAVVLKKWLETHFKGDGISAFVSSEIPKGSLWQPAVNAELQRADAGLVCLTAQSLDSNWVLFEAGALSTAVALNAGEARIFTYLLGVDPADLPGPLSVYQSTVATMEDTLLLINSLAVHPAIPPPGILADQSQHQDADRAYGTRPTQVPGPGPLGVPARDHIAVPAEHGIRVHHQVQSLEHVPREPVQQRRQQRPISRGEPQPARTELPLQDRELVAQREDLGVFVP